MSLQERETVHNWTSCSPWRFKTGPKTVFQNSIFQNWVDFSKCKLWKVCFSTASYKHCCSASFPRVSSSHERFLYFVFLKNLVETQQGFPFLNLHGHHEVQLWTVSRLCLLTKTCFLSFSGSNWVILWLLWSLDNYFK